MKLTAMEWVFAALMALLYFGGLYALISWSDRMRRKQIHAIFEAIRARGYREIVIEVKKEDRKR